jgi:small subunit ribosomal protein S8
MSVTDPIADMLTCIRNACQARHRRTDVPFSNLKLEIAKVMLREHFIQNFKVVEDDAAKKKIRIYLKYDDKESPVIGGLRRVSTPGRRVYVPKDQLPRVLGGLGTAVLSTSRGVITDKESRREGVGGEVLCYIW